MFFVFIFLDSKRKIASTEIITGSIIKMLDNSSYIEVVIFYNPCILIMGKNVNISVKNVFIVNFGFVPCCN